MNTPKNYKYSWGIDQRAIIESGLKIDIIDFSILRMLVEFATSGSCKKMAEDGVVFYMFRWSLIRDQLPILSLNTRQSVKRRMDKLITAKTIVPHPDNQQTRTSWFRFDVNKDVLFQNGAQKGQNSVNEKLQLNTKKRQKSQQIVTETVTNGLHSVNESSPDCHQSFTHTVTNCLHDNTNNNKTNNNNIYIANQIDGIKTNIPPSWSDASKIAVAQYLEYRQDLPTSGNIKTQKGWNAKIKRFASILQKYSEAILIKAIELSIEKEWKDVKVQWLFNEFPELKNQPKGQLIDSHELSPELQTKYDTSRKNFQSKEVAKRISYFTKQQYQGWMKGGANFEKWRDRGLLESEIYKKIGETIQKLNTSSFLRHSQGQLADFVEANFQNKIKSL